MKELPAPVAATGTGLSVIAGGLPEDELQPGDTATQGAGLKRQLSEMVQAEPAAMTRTLQAWLQEEQG